MQLVSRVVEKAEIEAQISRIVMQNFERISRRGFELKQQRLLQQLDDVVEHLSKTASSDVQRQLDLHVIDLRAVRTDSDHRMTNVVLTDRSAEQSSIAQLDDETCADVDQKAIALILHVILKRSRRA